MPCDTAAAADGVKLGVGDRKSRQEDGSTVVRLEPRGGGQRMTGSGGAREETPRESRKGKWPGSASPQPVPVTAMLCRMKLSNGRGTQAPVAWEIVGDDTPMCVR